MIVPSGDDVPGPVTLRRGRRAAVAVLATVLAYPLVGCARTPDEPQAEPAHRIEYFVSTVGTANGDIQVSYTSASGTTEQDSAAGFAQVWSTTVTTEPGLRGVSLQASGSSSDFSFEVNCSITVDGVRQTQSGPYGCSLTIDFERFRAEHPASSLTAKPPRSAPPAASVPPTAPRSAPAAAVPPTCRYVTEAEATDIVGRHAHGVIKPVLSTTGGANSCTYMFDYETGRVTFTWQPGGKADGIPGTELRGLGVPAYWTELGEFQTLDVQLPKGLFTVVINFLGLDLDRKAAAVDFFTTARPRLT